MYRPINFKESGEGKQNKTIYVLSGTYRCNMTVYGFNPLVDTKTWMNREWEFFEK